MRDLSEIECLMNTEPWLQALLSQKFNRKLQLSFSLSYNKTPPGWATMPPSYHPHLYLTLCCGPYISKVFNYRWFITKLSCANRPLPFFLPMPHSCCVEGTFTSLPESSFILKWVLPVNSLNTFWKQHVSCMGFGSRLVCGSFGIHQMLYVGIFNAHLILLRLETTTSKG